MILFGRRRRNPAATTFPRNYNVVPPAPVVRQPGPRLFGDGRVGVTSVLATIGEANTGRVLGQVNPEIRHVSWLLNRYGDAEMVFSVGDPAIQAGLVAPGRRIVLEFDNGLPAWGGTIEVPVDNDGISIVYRAYEAPHRLQQRYTPRRLVYTLATPGEIMAGLLDQADAEWPLGVDLQIVTDSDQRVSQEYNLVNLYTVCERDIWPLMEFETVPIVADTIRFTMRLATRVGRDLSNRVCLIEGVNIDTVMRTIQGPIVNAVTGAGNVGEWDPASATPRTVVTVRDDISIRRHGYRQGVEMLELADVDQITAYSNAVLEDRREPYEAISPTALNMAPALFSQYRVGDTVGVEFTRAPDITHTRPVARRIIGQEFHPAAGTCRLILA